MKKTFLYFLSVLVLLLAVSVPAFAEETSTFVFDVDDYLGADVVRQLNSAAKAVADQYECGVYIAVFEDMTSYGYDDIEEFAEAVYHTWDLGCTEDSTGILLVLSMEDRDYDLAAYGQQAHLAFTDYGKSVLADEFLDNFRNNDWAGGFADYITGCESLLHSFANGSAVDVSGANNGYIIGPDNNLIYAPEPEPVTLMNRLTNAAGPGIIVGVIVGLIYCGILKSKMKSVRAATEASEYVAEHGVEMYSAIDQFTHSTVVRQHIEHDSGGRSGGGGGTHVSSGGFSHSSGKF